MRDEVPDETLMARYASGDEQAFEELFRRYEPRAYAYFLKRTGSPERAEDLYQALFLRLHRARDSYDPGRSFGPWFFQIARRLLVDDCRRVFRTREIPIQNWDPPTEDEDSEHRLVRWERVDLLLQQLSADERYVLVGAKVGGVAYSDIAKDLDRSVVAVRKMASRAMRRVRAAADLPSAAIHTS